MATVLAQLVLGTGFCGLIIAPGVGLMRLLDRESTWLRAMAIGSVASLAAAILCGYYLLSGRLPFASLLIAEYLALGAVIIVRWRRPTAAAPPAPAGIDGGAPLLLLLLILVFVSRSLPLFFSEVPQGLDPCFHTLIAQKILQSGTIPTDWKPFETVRLNYPVGPHLLVAETARLTGMPVHVAFKCLFPALASLTTLLIYWLGFRFFGSRQAAWYAAVLYSFVGVWGSLDYYRWGGLPNLLGMLLLLGLVALTLEPRGRSTTALFALVGASLIVGHHHSSVCAIVLLLGYAVFIRVLAPALAETSRRILSALLGAALLAFLPLSNYLRGGSEVGQMSVLRFYEPLIPLSDGIVYLGLPLSVLGIAATVVLLRGEKRPETLFLTFWIAQFFCVFALLEYAYRFGVYLVAGEFYSALTPGRFLTNLVYPLSIASGFLLARLARNFKSAVVPAAILTASLIWAYFPIRNQCGPSEIKADITAFQWIAAHAEPDAFVVSRSGWAPYFTRRENAYTPLPASEARHQQWVEYKRTVLLHDLNALIDFSRTSGRSIYIPVPLQSEELQFLQEVYRGTETKIYRIAQ